MDSYDAWLADFRRRLAQHDAGVAALARDLASRTTWTVRCVGCEEFAPPPPYAGVPPDVLCERGDKRPIHFEVELPETLVRRTTVTRLVALTAGGIDPRIVLVGAPEGHERQIAETRRLLRRAGLPLEVAAIAPEEETITGADW